MQVYLCKVITIDNKKRITANPFTVGQKSTCTAKQGLLMKNADFHFTMTGRPLLHKFLHHSMQPMSIDQNFIYASPFQVFKPYLQQWGSINRQQTLGNGISQWSQ